MLFNEATSQLYYVFIERKLFYRLKKEFSRGFLMGRFFLNAFKALKSIYNHSNRQDKLYLIQYEFYLLQNQYFDRERTLS